MEASRVPSVVRESRRVQRHIRGAELAARRGASPKDAVARLNRLMLMDELRLYRQRGAFPINREWRGRVPQFIDPHGTRCAVAHLMDVSGASELVERIATTNNLASVRELARLAEVRAWLNAAGLTVEEAGRIQPSYETCCVDRSLIMRHEEEGSVLPCVTGVAETCFCGGSRSANIAIGTVVGEAGVNAARVRVDQIRTGFAELDVGAEVITPLSRPVRQGEKLLIASSADVIPGPGELPIVPRHGDLTVEGDAVYCNAQPDLKQHPVDIEDAIAALLSRDRLACVATLDEVDSKWGWYPPDRGDTSSCAYAPRSETSGMELASLALFAMLFSRRLRRTRAKRGA